MRRLLALILFVSSLAPLSLAQAADKLYFYTENFPPYNMSATGRAFEHKGDSIDGLCTDMVKAMMQHTELDYIIKLRNWDYGYNRVLDKKNHGIFCTTFTEKRSSQFKWIGPLTQNLWTIFAPPGSTVKIDSIEDVRGKKIGGYRNDVKTVFLQDMGIEVSALDSDELNPKRLALGQIDLWIADRLGGFYLASQQDVEGMVPAYSFNDTDLYLAMNPSTPDEVIKELNAALEKVKKTGMFEAIGDKYGL
ncbi:substrate-binding periplasmic protein [Marinobacter caseinilyticus]|uniref:substrate-binding periplasmic protein n=1 Tax=Marinobacter caseinilyticus TaxID=2692195 RepID=UPI00140D32D8|nr:ABC transporter substrate-binding protein [Marinobacter caseinilyticus]